MDKKINVKRTTNANGNYCLACWNTTLTFKQIADFCKLHVEIQGIADGEVAKELKLTTQLYQDNYQEKKLSFSMMKIDL